METLPCVQMGTAVVTTFLPLDHEEVLSAIFLCAVGPWGEITSLSQAVQPKSRKGPTLL